MSVDQKTRTERIVKREGVCGGSACISGTRIPVSSVVESWRRGVSEKELESYFATRPLTSAEIQAALQYYRDNKEEIEFEIRRNEEA